MALTISQNKITELLLKTKHENKERICPLCEKCSNEVICDCDHVDS